MVRPMTLKTPPVSQTPLDIQPLALAGCVSNPTMGNLQGYSRRDLKLNFIVCAYSETCELDLLL